MRRFNAWLVERLNRPWALVVLFLASFFLLYVTVATLIVYSSYKDRWMSDRGRDAYRAKDYASAERHFAQAVEMSNSQYDVLMWAASLIHSGRAGEVPRALDGLSRESLESWHLNVLGVGALCGGNYGDPTIWLEEAIRREPKDPLFHHNLAIAYERAGRKQDAARERRLAVKLGGPKFAKLKEPVPIEKDLKEEK